MVGGRYKKTTRVLLALNVVVCLVGTHWYAYRRGASKVDQENTELLNQTHTVYEAELLETQLKYLRLLARHPEDLPPIERLGWCRRMKLMADTAEKAYVPYYRDRGKNAEAGRLQRTIDEIRSLVAELNPEKQ